MSAATKQNSKVKIGLRLARVKAEIKAELDREGLASGPRQRLKLAVQSAHRLAASEDATNQLRSFVFLVSALFHHERHGGLTPLQVGRLESLGFATLRFLGIHPYSSRLSSLYADLHLALSQCYRRSGRHWKAAWEQQLSMQLQDKAQAEAKVLQDLALAMRSLRLGHADLALLRFQAVETALGVGPQLFEKARLERVRAMRLSGDRFAAADLVGESMQLSGASAPFLHELAWEQVCIDACETGNLSRMVAAVQRGSSHYHASFVMEAMLWCYSVANRTWIEQLPPLKTIVRNPKLRPKNLGFIYKAVRQVAACYDTEQPPAIRLKDLGDMLEKSHRLLTVDRELLFWLAATRWLGRVKAHTLAELTLRKYVALSLELSGGKSRDVLGHGADLLERSWHKLLESA